MPEMGLKSQKLEDFFYERPLTKNIFDGIIECVQRPWKKTIKDKFSIFIDIMGYP